MLFADPYQFRPAAPPMDGQETSAAIPFPPPPYPLSTDLSIAVAVHPTHQSKTSTHKQPSVSLMAEMTDVQTITDMSGAINSI